MESDTEDAELSEYEDMMDDNSVFSCAASDHSNSSDEPTPEAAALLTRVAQVQRQMHLKGVPTGSVSANDRLMKEIRELYRSENYKNGMTW